MIQEQLHNFLYNYSYITLYGLSFAYFIALYFGLAPLFDGVCKLLYSKKIAHKIVEKEVGQKQIVFEIKNSIQSILIFGTSIIPVVYFIRMGVITLLPNTIFNILVGLVILNVWNEIHFFIVHRTMHLPFFMRNVHYIHHKSKVPTVYSVYSFHWLEALLLSTVPLTISLFIPFSPIAIALYPLSSILINYSGHCNYRFGNGTGKSWSLFGTNHNDHHFKYKNNYGFLSPFLDYLLSKQK